jgi:hypothetical protein
LGWDFLQKLAQNFGDKTPIAIDRPGPHRRRCIATNGSMRFTKLYTRQKRRPPV